MKATFIAAAMASSSAFAHVEISSDQCDIDLNYDLSISPQHIRIIENDETMIDIYKDEIVFIKGEQIELNNEQQKLVTQYATDIRKSVPEVAQIATEAVSIAYQGINAALGQHIDMAETKEKFAQLEQKIGEKFNTTDGHYTFSQGEFTSNVESQEVEVMVEEIVEDMVPQLIGSLMANIGTAMAKGEANFDDFDNIGENIEKEVEARADELEKKAEAFCARLKHVDEIEADLIASNTQFVYFDLLNVK